MQLRSASFTRLVAALRLSKTTCTVVEQCCGGLISASIMAEPGASSVYLGGSVAYNTQRTKALLLNDDALHNSLLLKKPAGDPSISEEERYIQSKLDWTAKTAIAFCKELGTDYAIAEGGASGPTFRPAGMTTGFAVVAVAGKQQSDGSISILRQEVIRSDHADRERNMRQFADAAADIATALVMQRTTLPLRELNAAAATTAVNAHRSAVPEPSKSLILDRATHLRSDVKALAALECESAKYIMLQGNRILVKSATELALLSSDAMKSMVAEMETCKTFLGILRQSKPTAIFGVDLLVGGVVGVPESTMSFVETRSTAPLFSSIDNELALHATALAEWQRRTKFCSLCGGPTTFLDGGTSCQCNKCKTKSWPRQDPSMIVVISSRDGERVLLAHSRRHPPKFFTVLAGFVEAGETFEAAVAREALEETGVQIDEGSVCYVGSQPWPFPQSCMIGFTATADDAAPLDVDENELESAAWFLKSDVAKAATIPGATMQRSVAEAALRDNPTIPLLIPPKGVIARKLIDLWLNTEIRR